MNPYKPTVTVHSIEVKHRGSSPKEYQLALHAGALGAGSTLIGGFQLVARLTEDEGAEMDRILDKAIDRIRTQLRQGFD